MKYDSKQFELDLAALKHNREITKENYHKICGAIEITEAMLKNALEHEAKAAEEEDKKGEETDLEALPEMVKEAMKEEVRA